MKALLALFLALLPLAAQAERVVMGISEDEVSITATFDGKDILIFGAVQRESPIPQDSRLDVIITVAGPSAPVTVRRKAKQSVIWVNTDSLTIAAAPSFYAVASSAPVDQILSPEQDARFQISISQAVSASLTDQIAEQSAPFIEALIGLRAARNLYQDLPSQVTLDEETLFRTRIDLPADLTEGMYRARIFLLRDNQVIDRMQALIPVRKVGVERLLYAMARENPVGYGLASLAIAVLAGWLASAVFAALRR